MIINTENLKIFDISMPITKQMPVYKGNEAKRPNLRTESDFSTGSAFESILTMNLHTGTHLDRPLHMIPGGSTVETLDLTQVITDCKVIDLSEVSVKITKEHLVQKDISEGDFILLKTKNSMEDILETDFIYLDKTGGRYLKEKNIKGIGIDSLGIERSQPKHETHITLLGSDIVILEGLRLKDVEEGEYLLIAAPVNIAGAEAAPIRAVLIK
jgi:arylformamidase